MQRLLHGWMFAPQNQPLFRSQCWTANCPALQWVTDGLWQISHLQRIICRLNSRKTARTPHKSAKCKLPNFPRLGLLSIYYELAAAALHWRNIQGELQRQTCLFCRVRPGCQHTYSAVLVIRVVKRFIYQNVRICLNSFWITDGSDYLKRLGGNDLAIVLSSR